MSDITYANGFRNLLATTLGNTTTGPFYYFATLHNASGSALSSATDNWTGNGMAGELATNYGYTQGGKPLWYSASGVTLSTASANITVTNASNLLSVGQSVTCSGGTGTLQAGTTILAISGNTVTLNLAPSINGTPTTITFGAPTIVSANGGTNNSIDFNDVAWTANTSPLGPASYIAFWCNNTSPTTLTTSAKLIAVKDSSVTPQSASVNLPITGGVTNLLVF